MNFIIGRKPVMEALTSDQTIEKIYLQFGTAGDLIKEILAIARRKKIPISQLPDNKFERLCADKNTQGVIAFKPLQQMFEPAEILSRSKASKNPILLVIEEIQDTHNLGAILRSAECFGINGALITS